MDIEAFWQLIADSLEHAPGRVPRQDYLRDRLARLAPPEIVAFQALLDQISDQAYTWDLWGAAMRILGGLCSDDGFEDFRLWLVGHGRAVFEQAVAEPDTLAKVPAIARLAGRPRRDWDSKGEWPEWESLDTVAAGAYNQVTGCDDDCDEEFYDAVESVLSKVDFRRDPAGERWDSRDETAAALRIPALSALFPLNGAR